MLASGTHHLRFALAILFGLLVGMSRAADINADTIRKDLVGSWIIEVGSETRTRTLNIKGAAPGRDGTWNLDAAYGWTDGEQTSVSAQLIVNPEGVRLSLITQANSQISADSAGAGRFSGTFTSSSGKAQPARLERVSTEEAAKRAADLRTARIKATIRQPADDVPASCAGFIGVWSGNWSYYGRTWLWVTDVKADCVATCMNTSGSDIPNTFQACEIKGNVLSRSKPEGMEYYELRGAELWARFVPTSGAPNNTVFTRTYPSGR